MLFEALNIKWLNRSLLALLVVTAQTSCNTTSGAVGGALIGAGAGAAIDDDNRGRGALIGAAVGAASGGLAGKKIEQSRQGETETNFNPPPEDQSPVNYDAPPPP